MLAVRLNIEACSVKEIGSRDGLTHHGESMQSFWSKWGLCLLLFLATTLNYLDRQTLSVLAPSLQDEMHLDNEAFGWLFSGFYYSYTFSQLAVGMVLDRSHLRWAFRVGRPGVVRGVGPDWARSRVRRATHLSEVLLGVAESPNWPAALRIVSRAPAPRRSHLGERNLHKRDKHRRPDRAGADPGAFVCGGLAVGLRHCGIAWFGVVGSVVLVHPPPRVFARVDRPGAAASPKR